MTINRTHLAGFPELFSMEPYQTIDRASSNYKAGWNACIRKAEAAIAAQAQVAPEAEPVEVVAWAGDGGTLYPTMKSVRKYLPVGRSAEPLMAVAQHNRIMASAPQHDAELVELLREVVAELEDWRMSFPDANSLCTDNLLLCIDAKISTLSAKP